MRSSFRSILLGTAFLSIAHGSWIPKRDEAAAAVVKRDGVIKPKVFIIDMVPPLNIMLSFQQTITPY